MNFYQGPSTSREVPIQEPNPNEALMKLMSKLCDKIEQMEVKHDNLQTFVSQLANAKSETDATKGSLPSFVLLNPKSLNAIQLRSGKQVGHEDPNEDEEEVVYDESIQEQTSTFKVIPSSKSQKEKSILKKTSSTSATSQKNGGAEQGRAFWNHYPQR